MFYRSRVIIQILVTLASFLGFNEAVLAARYRNTLYLSNFSASMTMAESTSTAPAWLGYAGSGDIATLAGDPGNLKHNESPLRLAEFALRDLIKGSGRFTGEKTVDLVIGVAGYDFFHNRSAPSLSQLSVYSKPGVRCTRSSRNKEEYFKCMIREIYSTYGWQVEKIILTGDQNLLMASARNWLEKQNLNGFNFDAIQATTTAVPYQVRRGRITPDSSLLPKEQRFKGGYWDIGEAARDIWFSPVPYTKDSFIRFTSDDPVRQALAASDYVQDYGIIKHDEFAMFKRWSKTGVNTLGYQTARIFNNRHGDDYLPGNQAVSTEIYQASREQTGILVNDTIQQMVEIINLKQAEYYRGLSHSSLPIVIIGEFAADVLENQSARELLLQSLPDHERERLKIIPGNDFFYNLAAAGQRLLKH